MFIFIHYFFFIIRDYTYRIYMQIYIYLFGLFSLSVPNQNSRRDNSIA